MLKTRTDCCAFCQISKVGNNTSRKALQRAVDKLTLQMEANTEVGITHGNGQTAVFVVVSPGEDKLAANLEALGFEDKHTFDRRRGYPPGTLSLYIKNL